MPLGPTSHLRLARPSRDLAATERFWTEGLGPVGPDLLGPLERAGGRRVPARNPYWQTWAVTLEDPDGYRLVLSTRAW